MGGEAGVGVGRRRRNLIDLEVGEQRPSLANGLLSCVLHFSPGYR